MSIEFGFERRRRRFFLGIVTLFGSSALPHRKLSVRWHWAMGNILIKGSPDPKLEIDLAVSVAQLH